MLNYLINLFISLSLSYISKKIKSYVIKKQYR